MKPDILNLTSILRKSLLCVIFGVSFFGIWVMFSTFNAETIVLISATILSLIIIGTIIKSIAEKSIEPAVLVLMLMVFSSLIGGIIGLDCLTKIGLAKDIDLVQFHFVVYPILGLSLILMLAVLGLGIFLNHKNSRTHWQNLISSLFYISIFCFAVYGLNCLHPII